MYNRDSGSKKHTDKNLIRRNKKINKQILNPDNPAELASLLLSVWKACGSGLMPIHPWWFTNPRRWQQQRWRRKSRPVLDWLCGGCAPRHNSVTDDGGVHVLYSWRGKQAKNKHRDEFSYQTWPAGWGKWAFCFGCILLCGTWVIRISYCVFSSLFLDELCTLH